MIDWFDLLAVQGTFRAGWNQSGPKQTKEQQQANKTTNINSYIKEKIIF